MPNINPNLIPTKTAGTLFSALSGADPNLNIRWLNATDPSFYEVLNRPHADIAVRQLVIAKTVDNLAVRLSSQTLFPYLIQPRVSAGTFEVDVPLGLIWDISASIPKKWEKLRLAKILRMSGTNGTGSYTGVLRFIFSASVENSTTEVYIFYADYVIDSALTFQPARLQVVTTVVDPTQPINPGEAETVSGFIVFKTMDTSVTAVANFLDLVAPPLDGTDSNLDGFYDSPAIYEISDSNAGGSGDDDFSFQVISHGTGMLTDSAYNSIPALDSEIQTWLTTFNYPFSADANLTSIDGIVIPKGLFKEFNITAPAGDAPTGNTSGTFFPVYVSRIEYISSTSDVVRIYFATYNVTDLSTGGAPSTVPVEFGKLDLRNSGVPNEIIEIESIDNLKLQTGTDADEYNQHLGRGHVVLSDLWDGSTPAVDDFFTAMSSIVDSPADTSFTISSTRISAFGISRVPKYTPTFGQSAAMFGSTSRRANPVPPSTDNRFITEEDQGLGDIIDLEAQSGITPNLAIDRYGYSGALAHRMVKLVVDSTKVSSDPNFYEQQVLPRLRILLGRNPQFGDFWYNGTRLFFHNGDSWQS